MNMTYCRNATIYTLSNFKVKKNMKYITPFIIEIYIHDKIKIKLHYIYKRSSNIYIILRTFSKP